MNNWKRNIILFLSAEFLSLFGSLIVSYAIIWHIVLETNSGTTMTIFTIADFLPMFFISPFAGVWADRFNRKHIINLSDAFTAFFSLFAAVFLFLNFETFWILLFCAIARSIGHGVQMPAASAFIPQIVPKENLNKINGIQSSLNAFSAIAAPVVSAALMSFTRLSVLFLVDVITAAIGIFIVYCLVKAPISEKIKKADEKLNYFTDLKEGLKYIKTHKFLLHFFIICAVYFIAIAPAAFLTPLQVTRDFGKEVWRLSAIEIAFFIGMAIGGILSGFWKGFKNKAITMAGAVILCAICTAGLGIADNFWFYLSFMAFTGLFVPFFNTPAMTLVQTNVENEYLGRVMSVFTMISSSVMPSGMLLFGPLSDIVSIDLLLIISAVIMLFIAAAFRMSKELLKAGAI